MTTTRQHIEDLDVDKWATLTRRAAADSVAAAERLGLQPRAESVALARMTERELVEHRQRNGPPVPRRSLAMQLVEADHLRRVAEEQAREAHQGRLDAEAAASLARTEAGEAARVATAAGERVRAVEAEAARKDAERVAERAADQKAVQQAQAETERARAGAAAELAAAEEKVRAAEARAVERARIILACLEGKEIQQVARELRISVPSVTKWRERFSLWGLRGLRDQSRPGKPVRYDTAFRNRVLALLEEIPPPGMSHWDGPAVAEKLDASVHAVWRVLRREGIYLQRRRSWCVSTDKEFAPKAADVVGLYLNPPFNAVILSRNFTSCERQAEAGWATIWYPRTAALRCSEDSSR